MNFMGYNLGAGSAGTASLARSPAHHPFMTSRRSMPGHIGSMDRRDDSGSSSNYNPFVTTHQGPTQFQPVKLGIRPSDARVVKPPKAPEKPLMPYMRYHRKVWDEVKRTQPDAKLWEIGKIIGQKWRELPEEQKAEFNTEFEAEKAAYNEALKQYHNSPAYQAYLVAKSRQEQMQHEENESHSRAKMAKVVETDISIQPAEDDDDPDDGFSVKHAAAARFHRNQRLLVDIFSEVSVPDVRGIVTSHRIATLRRQVHSLEVHQKKLEDELKTLEERHENKKKEIGEASRRFDEEAAKLFEEKPEISEDIYNKMYEEALKQLKEQAAKDESHRAIEAKNENIQATTDAQQPEAQSTVEQPGYSTGSMAPQMSSSLQQPPAANQSEQAVQLSNAQTNQITTTPAHQSFQQQASQNAATEASQSNGAASQQNNLTHSLPSAAQGLPQTALPTPSYQNTSDIAQTSDIPATQTLDTHTEPIQQAETPQPDVSHTASTIPPQAAPTQPVRSSETQGIPDSPPSPPSNEANKIDEPRGESKENETIVNANTQNADTNEELEGKSEESSPSVSDVNLEQDGQVDDAVSIEEKIE